MQILLGEPYTPLVFLFCFLKRKHDERVNTHIIKGFEKISYKQKSEFLKYFEEEIYGFHENELTLSLSRSTNIIGNIPNSKEPDVAIIKRRFSRNEKAYFDTPPAIYVKAPEWSDVKMANFTPDKHK